MATTETPAAPEAFKPPATRIEYANSDLMVEIDNVTEQLTKTRKSLWSTQDDFKESEEKTRKLELHIAELVATREADVKEVKRLQAENSQCLEEEMKIRESLDLMKKVFARNQLKSKEDKETIDLLTHERDLLSDENKHLRDASAMSKNDKVALDRIKIDSQTKATQLTTILEKTKHQVATHKKERFQAESAIRQLTQRLLESRDKNTAESDKKLQRQRGKIDRLERQVLKLTGREAAEENERQDDLLRRAILDEDLEDGLTRVFMQNLDCTSFNEDLAANAYPIFGMGPKPHASFNM